LNTYFDHGLDVEQRRIFLLGDVDESPIGKTVKSLYYLDGLCEDTPIELFVGSLGGSEYEMLALYDVLMTIKSPIHTVALGKCMSAAPLLVAAGEKGHRYSMPNTQWMVHMSWAEPDPLRIDVLKKLNNHYEELCDRWYGLMANHSQLAPAQWKRICNRVGDTYFNAEMALEYGLVDQLWMEK